MKALAAFFFVPLCVVEAQSLTAAEVTARIRSVYPAETRANTVDTFKAGDSTTRVTGIAVTMMATLDVLQRSAKAGANLIITHEPTFYSHRDTVGTLEKENDPVLAAKQKFIRDNRLVVWRFHDIPHAVKPDIINLGIVHALGWSSYAVEGIPNTFRIPSTTLDALAARLKSKLNAPALRVSGIGSAKVSMIVMTPGFSGFPLNRPAIQRAKPDVVVLGEDHEWETIEYVIDAISAGQIKGLIVLGHIPSEQAGMELFAARLKSIVGSVPVHFIPTPEPFRLVR